MAKLGLVLFENRTMWSSVFSTATQRGSRRWVDMDELFLDRLLI